MIDIFCTFLWRYFFPPELLDSIHEFLFILWLHFRLLKNLSSCHKSSIGFRSGLSGRVHHQLIFCSSKKVCARLDVCFGSLSCMNRCSGSFSWIKGRRVDSRMLQKRSASMMPSKIQISVAPCLLIPAQT